jgi:glutamate-1-semialdehyde 2,1-aminomutase
VTPDLSTWGKAIANGVPLGAIAGKARYLDLALDPDPTRRVLIAGTYNSHPIPVAAAIATLRKLMDPALDVFGRLERLGARLQHGLEEIHRAHGVEACISRFGSAFCTYYMPHVPTNWWELLTGHAWQFDKAVRVALLERGIFQIPIAAKQGSISHAHTEADIDRTIEAVDDVLRVLRAPAAVAATP